MTVFFCFVFVTGFVAARSTSFESFLMSSMTDENPPFLDEFCLDVSSDGRESSVSLVLIVGNENDMSVEVGVSVEVVLIKGVLDGEGVSVEVVVSFTVGVSVEVGVLKEGVLDEEGVSV